MKKERQVWTATKALQHAGRQALSKSKSQSIWDKSNPNPNPNPNPTFCFNSYGEFISKLILVKHKINSVSAGKTSAAVKAMNPVTPHDQQQQLQLHNQIPQDEQSSCSGGTKKRDLEVNNGSGANKDRKGVLNRRPRGRPAGSKNKPKPPVIIARNSVTVNALRTHVFEIGDGFDIVESVATFARKRQRMVCIMGVTGTVTNVTLRQLATADAIVPLHGRFEILSLAGSFLPPPAPPAATGLTISVAGEQGQVVGGRVVGPLTCSGPVVIMATSFSKASYDRLPVEEDEPQLQMQRDAIGSPTASGGQL
ncbi:hypothetical protein GQ457_07G010300 [Hibiscus cannabinus]